MKQRVDEKRLSSYRAGITLCTRSASLLRFPNFAREHLTLMLAGGRNKNAADKVKWRASRTRMPTALPQDRKAMDTTTLLIIVIIVLLLGGGGFYGRGRWW